MTEIQPEEKFCDYVDGVFVTGFKQPGRYFLIQRVDKNPKNIYIELNDQGQGEYSGLAKVDIEHDRLIFYLNPEGQRKLNTDAIQIKDNIANNATYDTIIVEIKVINECLRSKTL